MKVYFSKTEPEMNGYVHISDFKMMDLLVDDAQAEEIIVNDTLSTISFDQLPNVFSLLCSKLRMGGQIVIYYTDMSLICPQYERDEIQIEKVNELLRNRESILNEDVVANLVSQNGLKIVNTGYNANFKGYMVTKR